MTLGTPDGLVPAFHEVPAGPGPVERLQAAIDGLEPLDAGRTTAALLDFLRFCRSVAGARVTGELEQLVVGFGLEFADAILGEQP